MGDQIYFKIAGQVNLDMLNMSAVKLNLYLPSFDSFGQAVSEEKIF
jgi:hypothetical protein